MFASNVTTKWQHINFLYKIFDHANYDGDTKSNVFIYRYLIIVLITNISKQYDPEMYELHVWSMSHKIKSTEVLAWHLKRIVMLN